MDQTLEHLKSHFKAIGAEFVYNTSRYSNSEYLTIRYGEKRYVVRASSHPPTYHNRLNQDTSVRLRGKKVDFDLMAKRIYRKFGIQVPSGKISEEML